MDDKSRRAWAYLSRVAEPPNPLLAELVTSVGAVETADLIRRRGHKGLLRATAARYDIDSAEADLEVLDRLGGRLITAEDEEWPHLAFAGFRTLDHTKRPQGHPPLVLWVVGPLALAARENRGSRIAGFQDLLNISGISGKKQVRPKRRDVTVGTFPPGKGSTGDRQTVMLNGVEHAQASVRAVSR